MPETPAQHVFPTQRTPQQTGQPALSAMPRRTLPLVDDVQDWTAFGSCRTQDPDDLFVTGAAQNRAKAVCLACPVRTECLADALDNRVEFGVWGGMTERERRALLRRRPEVESWRELLESARRDHAERSSAS